MVVVVLVGRVSSSFLGVCFLILSVAIRRDICRCPSSRIARAPESPLRLCWRGRSGLQAEGAEGGRGQLTYQIWELKLKNQRQRVMDDEACNCTVKTASRESRRNKTNWIQGGCEAEYESRRGSGGRRWIMAERESASSSHSKIWAPSKLQGFGGGGGRRHCPPGAVRVSALDVRWTCSGRALDVLELRELGAVGARKSLHWGRGGLHPEKCLAAGTKDRYRYMAGTPAVERAKWAPFCLSQTTTASVRVQIRRKSQPRRRCRQFRCLAIWLLGRLVAQQYCLPITQEPSPLSLSTEALWLAGTTVQVCGLAN